MAYSDSASERIRFVADIPEDERTADEKKLLNDRRRVKDDFRSSATRKSEEFEDAVINGLYSRMFEMISDTNERARLYAKMQGHPVGKKAKLWIKDAYMDYFPAQLMGGLTPRLPIFEPIMGWVETPHTPRGSGERRAELIGANLIYPPNKNSEQDYLIVNIHGAQSDVAYTILRLDTRNVPEGRYRRLQLEQNSDLATVIAVMGREEVKNALLRR